MAASPVLFVLPSLEVGGAERVVVRLLRDLPRDRLEPHVALVRRAGPLLRDLPPDVPVHDLGARRVRFAAFPVARLARRIDARIVFSTLGHLNLALLSSRALLPAAARLVVREANTVSAEVKRARLGLAWRLGYRWLYPRADAIVCPSRAVLEDLATEFATPRNRLHHIPNPIDAVALREEGAKGGSPYPFPGRHVLSVGRLARQKGFVGLIDAFDEVVQADGEAHLWIVGEGPERPALESRVAELRIGERVHLPGFVENPFAWMHHATLYVQSSEFEGLPNALLEALACGTPAIALDEPGGTQEIVDGAGGALLLRDRSPTALGRAIVRVLREGPAGEPSLPEEYTPERVVAAYVELLTRLSG